MLKNSLSVLVIALMLAVSGMAHAAEQGDITKRDWAFSGPFGHFDRPAMQRGLQVYREVCAACHGLRHIAFRNLAALGYSEGQVKAIAAEYDVTDGPDDAGEFFTRPGIPSDRIPGPFENEAAARASNNGAYPPDLSLIIKARPDGANYLYSLLTSYGQAPDDMDMPDGMYFNHTYAGRMIAMAPPLDAGLVDYADGTAASVENMAADVVTFLAWTAEPEMEARKRIGIAVMLFLIVMVFVSYGAKRYYWAPLKRK